MDDRFPCIRDRFGKSEEADGRLLSVAASIFYSELTKEEDKELLVKTMKSVAKGDSPYHMAANFKRLNPTE